MASQLNTAALAQLPGSVSTHKQMKTSPVALWLHAVHCARLAYLVRACLKDKQGTEECTYTKLFQWKRSLLHSQSATSYVVGLHVEQFLLLPTNWVPSN